MIDTRSSIEIYYPLRLSMIDNEKYPLRLIFLEQKNRQDMKTLETDAWSLTPLAIDI